MLERSTRPKQVEKQIEDVSGDSGLYGRNLGGVTEVGVIEPYFETPNGKLYHGDCFDILPDIGSYDVVITDPPYGCDATTGWGGVYNKFEIIGDKNTACRDRLLQTIFCPVAMVWEPTN